MIQWWLCVRLGGEWRGHMMLLESALHYQTKAATRHRAEPPLFTSTLKEWSESSISFLIYRECRIYKM